MSLLTTPIRQLAALFGRGGLAAPLMRSRANRILAGLTAGVAIQSAIEGELGGALEDSSVTDLALDAVIGYSVYQVATDMVAATVASLLVSDITTPGRQAMLINRLAGLDRRLSNMVDDGRHTIVQQEVIQRAADADAYVVWVAERNACPRCLDLNGAVAAPGQPFRGMGVVAGEDGDVLKPPRHPNCRCHLEVLAREDSEGVAGGLQREGARSAALGMSDYASQPELRRVANAVLGTVVGQGLPRTVRSRAAALAAGDTRPVNIASLIR